MAHIATAALLSESATSLSSSSLAFTYLLMGDSVEAACKQTGDVCNSDKMVNNVEILAQSSHLHTVFRALTYWAHRMVIFVIAQFSCFNVLSVMWLLFTCYIAVLTQEVVKYTKRILKMGDRSTYPSKGDTVECYYTGKLDNGKVFDTNVDDGM